MTHGSPGWGWSRSYILLLYKSHKTRTTCRIRNSMNKMRGRSTKMPYLWFHVLFLDPYLRTSNTLYGSMFSYTLRPHWKWVCCSVVSVRRIEVSVSTNTKQSHSRNLFPLLNTTELLRRIQSCCIDWLFVPMPMYLS